MTNLLKLSVAALAVLCLVQSPAAATTGALDQSFEIDPNDG
jgi:hypothetical protein